MKYQYFSCRSKENANKLIRVGDFYCDVSGSEWYRCLGFVGKPMSQVNGAFARIRRPLKSAVVAKPAANKPKLSAPQIAALKRIGSLLLTTPQGRSAVRALLKKCASTSA